MRLKSVPVPFLIRAAPACLQAHRLTYLHEKVVFSNVSFTASNGSCVLLYGPNGSGKTTCLNVMTAVYKPAEGALLYNGVDVFDDMAWRHEYLSNVSYTGTLDLLVPEATVEGNMQAWHEILAPKSPRERIQQVLEAVGLWSRRHLPPAVLSMGQRKRLELARVFLADERSIWLLDEPTVGLDRLGVRPAPPLLPQRRGAHALSVRVQVAVLEQCIEAHRRRGGIVFVSSHQNIRLRDASAVRFVGRDPELASMSE